MTIGYAAAPSNARITMSWLARLRRGRQAAAAREHARLNVWESEGGSLPSMDGRVRYRTDEVCRQS